MILELKLTDDSGQVVVYTASEQPWQPLQWKAPTGHPIVIDKNKNDCYLLYAFTIQPTCNLSLNFRKGINVASQPMQFPSQYQPNIRDVSISGIGNRPVYNPNESGAPQNPTGERPTTQINPPGYPSSVPLPTGNLFGTKPESGK